MGASGTGAREKRVAERIRADLSDMISRGDIRDPAASGVIVSDVQVTNDLSLARVFVRVLVGEPDAGRKKKLLDALGRASGFLRRELASTLSLRRVPELRFAWDDGVDRASRLDELFHEIASEREKKG